MPMIMGANIGTSITNTLVSLTQVSDPRRLGLELTAGGDSWERGGGFHVGTAAAPSFAVVGDQ